MLVCDNKYIPKQDKDFFILLRAGLWQRFEGPLSDNPGWNYIYRLACEQTVLGIIADGIEVMELDASLPLEWQAQFVTDATSQSS